MFLDTKALSNDEMLFRYKAQQSAERFGSQRHYFFTDGVFSQVPERVEALAMLMGLCLLVIPAKDNYVKPL